jgi:hypothetical protein
VLFKLTGKLLIGKQKRKIKHLKLHIRCKELESIFLDPAICFMKYHNCPKMP